jgi:hypothetical protein
MAAHRAGKPQPSRHHHAVNDQGRRPYGRVIVPPSPAAIRSRHAPGPSPRLESSGSRWIRPPPAQVINPGAILACWSCLARPKTPSSRARRRGPDPVRIGGGERPAGQRGTSSSWNVVQSFGYRAIGAAAGISCRRVGTSPGDCIPAGWWVAREGQLGARDHDGGVQVDRDQAAVRAGRGVPGQRPLPRCRPRGPDRLQRLRPVRRQGADQPGYHRIRRDRPGQIRLLPAAPRYRPGSPRPAPARRPGPPRSCPDRAPLAAPATAAGPRTVPGPARSPAASATAGPPRPGDTRPQPSAETATRRLRALLFIWKVPSAGNGRDLRQALSSQA